MREGSCLCGAVRYTVDAEFTGANACHCSQCRRQSGHYWAAGDGLDFHATERGSDVDLLFERCITVTPLRFDLTRHEDLTRWRERLRGAGA